jgi:hydroxypyruvate isomerase
MPKFAANLSMMFNEWEFLDRFAAAADAGFTAVEFLFPYAYEPDEIAKRLASHGLTQALFNLPPGDFAAGDRGLAAIPERAGEFRASVATALRYAEATGVKRLHVMSGNADSGDPLARAAYENSLSHAVDRIGAEGLDVVIEPINKRDMPGYFLDDFNHAAALIGKLGLPRLKLQYDIYHRQILHGDVVKSLEALMPIIGHVQTAAVPERHEPGTGELDDDFVFQRLDALGYAGYVGCEYRPAGATLAGLAWWDAWRWGAG